MLTALRKEYPDTGYLFTPSKFEISAERPDQHHPHDGASADAVHFGGPSRHTASLTFARSRRSSGDSLITAVWISAGIGKPRSAGLVAHSHHMAGCSRATMIAKRTASASAGL